ncbi:MAG TPA: polysaccharide deacetylase family protein [Solirubrobacteraceae bacterium]|jgi:peptidoglycan/xylan/chitin deacetylase (PgdA/CDA1 family)|nr:polysaccharide deacetylase family protein [Solirubrobacteraceae bacterium]
MTFVLTYHDVASSGEEDECGFPGAAAARYKLTPSQFAAHLDAISATGRTVGLFPDRPDAALSFDDGGASAPLIADALEQRGWRGHFFITTGRVGTKGFLAPDAIRELAARGHDVGSHSVSHPTYMGLLSATELSREWRHSRDALGEILGRPPASAAVPGGFVSEHVLREAANAGYRLLLTSYPSGSSKWVDGMQVHGRYAVWARTSPGRAAGYARGDLLARSTLWLASQAKTVPKRISPKTYELVRQGWARRHTAR